MRKIRFIAYWILIACSFSFAQAFVCDGQFYVVAEGTEGSFLEVFKVENNEVISTNSIALSEPERQYTCLGMSVEDMHLYALDFNTKELLRINAVGEVEALGIPENLNLDLEYWSGDIDPEGRRMIALGKNKANGKDEQIYSISLTREDHYAGSVSVISDRITAITDLATDPIRGGVYGYDKNNKQIVAIGTSTVTHHQHQSVEPFIESLFFDDKGNLYGYGGSEEEQSILYAINKITGEMTALSSGKKGRASDGCSCPYRLKFYRTITPETLIPCQEFTIYYTIINEAGEGKTRIYFEDILPEGMIITELVEHTFTLATPESSVGSRHLLISNLDIVIGKNVIVVKAKLDNTTKNKFETQANLQGLPIGLGGELYSDDPSTSDNADANISFVTQAQNLELEDFIDYDCERAEATLSLPINADRYLWSDGSTDASLIVDQSAWYWVEAESECLFLRDSIYIDAFPEKLSLDLGTDLSVRQGNSLALSFQTNAETIQQIQWSSAQNFDLSCDDCELALLNPLRSNTYYLELTNERGCKVKDSISITVEQVEDIYFANAFSPNGDQINDVFYLQGIDGLANIRLFQVFDRWGNLVFTAKDIPINKAEYGWDGRLQGKEMNADTYIWIAEIAFLDGKALNLSGAVDLIGR